MPNVNEVLHRIRAKLYHNYLPNINGKYIARTQAEAPLSVEDVCAAAKNRGGFTGSYEDLVKNVTIYLDEAAYQLADGFAVQNDYYCIYPKINGTFDKVEPAVDLNEHPVAFNFRVKAGLRKLSERITVTIEGIAETGAYIDEILDVSTGLINETFTAGEMTVISGHNIKIAGSNQSCGLYFDDEFGNKTQVPLNQLAQNTSSKIIAKIPQLAAGKYRIRIVTQFTHGSALLKEPRIILSSSELDVFTPTSG
ncbi:hypothetical protein FACS1894172_01980 [Spirochaetia bacterium]|nr:hypothetical protein FACS1894172_01980 [Spirochaetia bacterium]